MVELLRSANLLDNALFQHDDAVAQRHGLSLIVGDVDSGGAEAFLQLGNFGAHLDAELGVQV